jgi:hypothetical protein
MATKLAMHSVAKLLDMFPNIDQGNMQESVIKAKRSFTSAEGCSHKPESDGQSTLSGISSVFISICPSP